MLLNPPEAVFHVVNNSKAVAADSWPLHRLGGAFFDDYVFLSTPRNAGHAGFFLDLEVNFFGYVGDTTSLMMPEGVTWGLPGGVILPDRRILSRVEAFNAAAPTVLWVETDLFIERGLMQKAKFQYMVPKFGLGSPLQNGDFGPLPPQPSDIKTLTFDGQPDQVHDFTTAGANGKIYLFWMVPNGSEISWAVFDGTNVLPLGQLTRLSPNTTVSIDATAVQMTDPATGKQTICLAVVALSLDGTFPQDNHKVPRLWGWLFRTDGTLVRTLQMPALPSSNPADIDAFSSTIRATWGTLAAESSAATNGLVLSYVPSHGNARFNIAPEKVNINAMGSLWVTQLDLAGSNLVFDWTLMDPPLSLFPNRTAMGAVGTSGPLSVLFPIPLARFDTNELTVYIGIAAAAMWNDLLVAIFGGGIPQFYMSVFRSFTLTRSDPGRSRSSGVERSYTRDDIVAALGSWTLIGMITGLPPYYDGQPKGSVQFTYGLDTTQGKNNDLSTAKTVTVGGTVGPIKGSFANAVVKSDASTTETQLTQTLTWTNGPRDSKDPRTTLEADRGVALFWLPDYQSATYEVENAVRQPTGLTLSMLWASGGGRIDVFEFCLTDLNRKVGESLLAQVFAESFPSAENGSQVVWPASNDPEAWTLGRIPPLTEELHEIRGVVVANVSVTETLRFSTTKATTMTNTLTIKIGLEASAFQKILGLEFGGELTTTSTVTTTFGQSQTFTIKYDGIAPGAPNDHFFVKPLLLRPSANGARWMPIHNAAQRPWLLTWITSEFRVLP